MLEVKKSVATPWSESEQKSEYLDAEIDKLVCELYGLTEEEIKIVEGTEK